MQEESQSLACLERIFFKVVRRRLIAFMGFVFIWITNMYVFYIFLFAELSRLQRNSLNLGF